MRTRTLEHRLGRTSIRRSLRAHNSGALREGLLLGRLRATDNSSVCVCCYDMCASGASPRCSPNSSPTVRNG